MQIFAICVSQQTMVYLHRCGFCSKSVLRLLASTSRLEENSSQTTHGFSAVESLLSSFAAKMSASFLNTAPFVLFAISATAYLKAADAEGVVAKAFTGPPARMSSSWH